MSIVNNEDSFYGTRVLRLLLQPFNKQDAFQNGLIDDKGNVVKEPKSKKEKDSLTALHRVVFKIKQIIEELPSGSSRMKQLAVALQGIKKKPVPNAYLDGIAEDYCVEFLKSLVFVTEHNLSLIEEETIIENYIETLFEEGEALAPTNTTASIEPKGAPAIYPGDKKPKVVKRKPLEIKIEESNMNTLYVHRPVLNHQEIADWYKSQGFQKTLGDDMHVTICYSRNPVTGVEPKTEELTLGDGTEEHRKVNPLGDGGAIVMHINSPELQERWKEFRDAGASWDYDGYNPHVTITYEPGDVVISEVKPYLGRIVLGAEEFEPLNEDWAAGVEEK